MARKLRLLLCLFVALFPLVALGGQADEGQEPAAQAGTQKAARPARNAARKVRKKKKIKKAKKKLRRHFYSSRRRRKHKSGGMRETPALGENDREEGDGGGLQPTATPMPLHTEFEEKPQ